MADLLIEISKILLENVYRENSEKILNNAKILETILKIKQKVKLSLDFNIEHNLKGHDNVYELSQCESEHCFNCLYEELLQGAIVCEHGIHLTPFELAHIPWIFDKINKGEA